LNEDARVNQQNKDGWTALQVASQRGNEKVVKVLLEKGADFNMRNHKGETPLSVVKTKAISQLLKDAGAK